VLLSFERRRFSSIIRLNESLSTTKRDQTMDSETEIEASGNLTFPHRHRKRVILQTEPKPKRADLQSMTNMKECKESRMFAIST